MFFHFKVRFDLDNLKVAFDQPNKLLKKVQFRTVANILKLSFPKRDSGEELSRLATKNKILKKLQESDHASNSLVSPIVARL